MSLSLLQILKYFCSTYIKYFYFNLNLKIIKKKINLHFYFVEVPEKDAKSTDSEVILRRTQSFENDEKYVSLENTMFATVNIIFF